MEANFVVFEMEGRKFAVSIASVERIINVIEILPLPGAPEIVIGIINVAGRIIPVFNIRNRFNFPNKEIALDDRIIIFQTKKRTVALLVGKEVNVIEILEKDVIKSDDVLPELIYISGVVKLKNGLLLINNINEFLSLKEEEMLNNALCH